MSTLQRNDITHEMMRRYLTAIPYINKCGYPDSVKSTSDDLIKRWNELSKVVDDDKWNAAYIELVLEDPIAWADRLPEALYFWNEVFRKTMEDSD